MAVSDLPYMPFYIESWDGDEVIQTMNLEEECIYFRLSKLCWKSEKKGYLLVKNKKVSLKILAEVVRVPFEKLQAWFDKFQAIYEIFGVDNGVYFSRKQVKLIEKSNSYKGKKKLSKSEEEVKKELTQGEEIVPPTGVRNRNRNRNRSKNSSLKSFKDTSNYNLTQYCDFFNDSEFQESWVQWNLIREKCKCSFTETAMKKAINKLMKLSGGKKDLAIEILDQSSVNKAWSDIYPLDNKVRDPTNKKFGRQEVKEEDLVEQRSWLDDVE